METSLSKIRERFHLKREFDFESLPAYVRDDFTNQMIVKNFKRGQNIFTEGAFPSGIYFVKKGKIKKFKTLNSGKEQIIYLCSEGEMIGYAAFLGEERYHDSAAAITESSIGFISKESLVRLLDKHQELSKLLVKKLSHEFGVMVNFIATFTKKSVRERVALTLLILNENFRQNKNDDNEIQIDLTREDFSNIVGIAIETLVRLLSDFEKDGLISKKGRKIIVREPLKLFKIADLTDAF
ncbi:MAG: Crp/Fnr family transcriptional regulator [Bacteroidetes bacterium HGW-Bacteroidetes-1]|nr:MAG: Crp/Fnr family transcriptional regulator [Bacteroidetes bacterium HGW-Bacteroidetes-1]